MHTMSGPNIAILDYQAGNLRSVHKALERSGARAIITSDAGDIERADALVFPGQGANDSSMHRLRARELVDPIKDFVASGRPFLGLCLGLQLMLEASDEGVEPGLGVLAGLPTGSYFYFAHGYYAEPENKAVVAGTTTYGIEFCSAVAWDKVVAVQFHPEKSGDIGLKIYRNFVRLAAESRW